MIVSTLHLWLLVRLTRRPARLGAGNILALISEIAAPLLAVWRIPKSADSPWSLLRWYVPDLTTWLSAMSVVSFIKTLLWLYRLLSRSAQK